MVDRTSPSLHSGEKSSRRLFSAHLTAVLQALFVAFLWSTSWVLIKLGLQASLPPVTFAGLRYALAFVCLAPFVIASPAHRAALQAFTRRTWGWLALLGVVYYAVTMAGQYIGLAYLPSATVTVLLNFTPVLIALAGGWVTSERPTRLQWGGILLSVAGAVIYFLPLQIPAGQGIGLAAALVGLAANAVSAVLGRKINHQSGVSPLLVTFTSMGIGGAVLLGGGALIQGFGPLDRTQWLIIGWLAVVNTAAAFTLWNHTLRTLTAVESSIINGTMLPQIAILAWVFLGEPLNPRQIGGILLVAAGTLIVQLRRRARPQMGVEPQQG